jgi:hypothetical protein
MWWPRICDRLREPHFQSASYCCIWAGGGGASNYRVQLRSGPTSERVCLAASERIVSRHMSVIRRPYRVVVYWKILTSIGSIHCMYKTHPMKPTAPRPSKPYRWPRPQTNKIADKSVLLSIIFLGNPVSGRLHTLASLNRAQTRLAFVRHVVRSINRSINQDLVCAAFNLSRVESEYNR